MVPKFLLFFFIIFFSIAINLPDSMIARLGVDADYLLAALIAMVIAGLIVHRGIFLVVLVLTCTIAANLTDGMADYLGFDRDIIFATLIALVIIPFISGRVGHD